jgi:hypothetical protein
MNEGLADRKESGSLITASIALALALFIGCIPQPIVHKKSSPRQKDQRVAPDRHTSTTAQGLAGRSGEMALLMAEETGSRMAEALLQWSWR